MRQRNEGGDTLVEWATSTHTKIMTHNFRRKQIGDGHGEALMETLQIK